MARGGPDFGAVAPRALTTPVLDMGELAVRLGSPVAFDRRGTVVGIVSGSRLGDPHTTTTGLPSRTDLVPLRTLVGGYSLRMFVTSSIGAVATTERMPYLGDAGAAVEAIFQVRTSLTARLQLAVKADDGDTQVEGRLRRDTGTGAWQFWNSAGAWVDTPTQPASVELGTWYSMKVAIDPTTGLYLYSIVNGEDTGVRGIAAESDASVLESLTGAFTVFGADAADQTVYLSDMIYTVNEL